VEHTVRLQGDAPRSRQRQNERRNCEPRSNPTPNPHPTPHPLHHPPGKYVIDARTMRALKERAVVLHPLPRVDEIAVEVDDDPRAAYFRQARNGLYIRMALIKMALLG